MQSLDPEEMTLMLDVTRRFYVQDQPKVAIASALGLSRFQVARILSDARRHGVVRIEIGAPGYLDETLGQEIAGLLNVKRAIVVHVEPGARNQTVEFIGRTLATTLDQTVSEGDLIGLTWSRAIEAMTMHLTHLRPCTVVQLAGAVSFQGEYMGSVEIIRKVAEKAGGTAKPIYAPLLVDDPVVANGLRRQADIADVLQLASRLDIAVTSIGSWRPMGSALFDLVHEDLRQQLAAAGAVGEISGRIFDRNGQLVPSELDDRIIGVSMEQLTSAQRTITTSYGVHRAEATWAAAKAGLVDTLILDNFLAQELLNHTH